MDEAERRALAEEVTESRWEAAPAVLAVIVFQLALAMVSRLRDWKLWGLAWWVWTIAVAPESILLVALAWDRARRWLERIGHRRNAALNLAGRHQHRERVRLARVDRVPRQRPREQRRAAVAEGNDDLGDQRD